MSHPPQTRRVGEGLSRASGGRGPSQATRRPTIADVAALADVSTATVSRILTGVSPGRPQTRERVIAAVGALRYQPSAVARALRVQATSTIGLLITDIENPFFPQLVRAVEEAGQARGYGLLLCNAADDADREAGYLSLLAERRVDGMIVASTGFTKRHRAWLATAAVPVVLANCDAPRLPVRAVLSDNAAGGRLAAEFLLGLGHRAIGYIAGPATATAARERLAGFSRALAAQGLELPASAFATGDAHVAGGERAMVGLLARNPGLTAVACFNDLTAIGALRSARVRGLAVPGDLSIVGFDDIEMSAYTEPPLTTVAQDTSAMGRLAVEILLAQLGRAADARDTARASVLRLPVRMRERGSAARPA